MLNRILKRLQSICMIIIIERLQVIANATTKLTSLPTSRRLDDAPAPGSVCTIFADYSAELILGEGC